MSDIYIKDEGEFATIVFLTSKAKEIADEENLPIYESDCHKINVGFNQVNKILYFAKLHELTIDSELTEEQININT